MPHLELILRHCVMDEDEREPLPDTLNRDGRSVWEPPIIDYSDVIGDEYEEKRKAVLRTTRGNVEKATENLDKEAEWRLLDRYLDYVMRMLQGPDGKA